eukprot:4120967-Pyramimonas_sp.AAC.1
MAPAEEVSTEASALSQLRTADVFKGEGGWVLLDEVCNTCCRGEAWALDAEDKFETFGFFPEWLHRQRKSCSVFGKQAGGETTGEKSFPFRTVASRGAVIGCLESYQLKDSDR